jgi:hypothetical protein
LTEMWRPVFLKKIVRCFLATFDVCGVCSGVTEVPCWMTLTFVEGMELNGFVYTLVWSVGMRCCMVLYIVCGFTTLFSEGLCMWMSIDGHVLVVWRFVFVMFGQIGI